MNKYQIKSQSIKERFWDNRTYRITDFNECVHPHYRQLFEDIASATKI